MPCSDSIFVIKLTTSRARKFYELVEFDPQGVCSIIVETRIRIQRTIIYTYKLQFLFSIYELYLIMCTQLN